MINPYLVLYNAQMTVKRHQKCERDGYKKNELSIIAENVRCRYSVSGQTEIDKQTSDVSNAHTLFCGIDEDVKEGDIVSITLSDKKAITGQLGECQPYTYQWQCEFKRSDNYSRS